MNTDQLDMKLWPHVVVDAWLAPAASFGAIFGLLILNERYVGAAAMNVPAAELWPYVIGAIVAVGLVRTLNLRSWSQNYRLSIDEETRTLDDGELTCTFDDIRSVAELPGGYLRVATPGGDIFIPGFVDGIEQVRETLSNVQRIEDQTSGVAAIQELWRRYDTWVWLVVLPPAISLLVKMT
ncbi:hypothetical protein FIV42_02010 [Persicimonas caeni]|uniref:PH domain-containing protein n=1 Tax=Persicimonas caeni TaxID=2292766 RepID=A0A4Y6PML4_PERCE|nr:hypothetical protein [Persicimonas caeni]QDG49554.1 hypothetical protein FIV42_02010 [Persicimonas caeni]QED30775.1 hypothetical protein FRD00_02005 [Persicimonas caeni]